MAKARGWWQRLMAILKDLVPARPEPEPVPVPVRVPSGSRARAAD